MKRLPLQEAFIFVKKNNQMQMIKTILHVAFILFCMGANAQEVNLNRGNLSILKDEKTINIEFTYDKMTVGDDGKEADYIKRKRQW